MSVVSVDHTRRDGKKGEGGILSTKGRKKGEEREIERREGSVVVHLLLLFGFVHRVQSNHDETRNVLSSHCRGIVERCNTKTSSTPLQL